MGFAMKQPNYEALELVLSSKPILIDEQTILDLDFWNWMVRKQIAPSRIAPLMAKSDPKNPTLWHCVIECDYCHKAAPAMMNKTAITNYAAFRCGYKTAYNFTHFLCDACKDREREIIQERQEQARKEKLALSEQWHSRMLSEVDGWPEYQEAGDLLREYEEHTERWAIAARVRALPYHAFLKTAYWRCVSTIVRERANHRCQMCNRADKLNVHHRNYYLHGLEHTWKGFNDLICICKPCHEKHHLRDYPPEGQEFAPPPQERGVSSFF